MTFPATWVGIDPGAKGAMCSINEHNEIVFLDYAKEGIIGYSDRLQYLLKTSNIKHVCIEQVHAMPGQGVKSMFSFGQRFGELIGMLQALKIGYSLLPPREWQKMMKITDKSGKKGTFDKLSEMYPTQLKQLVGIKGGILDGRCDALGIASAARIKFNK